MFPLSQRHDQIHISKNHDGFRVQDGSEEGKVGESDF